MSTLDDLRREINSIDVKLKELFIKRMGISAEIGKIKLSSNDEIYDDKREAEIIDRFLADTGEECLSYAESFYKNLLNMSRARQYLIHAERNVESPLTRLLKNAEVQIPAAEKICYQGIDGSWSGRAAREIYPDAAAFQCPAFEDVFENVASGKVQAGIVPIDNSTAGGVNDVYDLLVSYDLYITHALTLDIEHCLLGTTGAEITDIKRVYSHPQALSQCGENLRKLGAEGIPESNTAVAAELVAKLSDKEAGAVASYDAAGIYGLKVLRRGFNDSDFNRTRFLAVSKHLVKTKNSNRLSIALKLPNKSGALHAALLIFAANSINLTKIFSRPIPNKPWEYIFYIDCEINREDPRVHGALMQLEKELSWVKLLGCYTEL